MKKLYYIILFLMITSGINAQWKYSSQDGSQIRSLNKNGDILYATTIYNIYTSKDEGLTWQASKISHNVFSRSEFAFRNETAFLASSSRIYRSNDQGTSWKEILYSDNANLKTIIVKGDTIFAAGLYSFHRSYDDGKTWTEIDLSNPAEELYIEDLELKGDSLFASCQYGLYFSIDQGNTWKKTNPAGVNYPGQLIQFKNTFLILIYKDMLASTDNGKSWTSTGLSASWVTTNNSVAYACSKDGIYSSNDGIIWSKISNYPFPTTWGLLTVTGSNFCLGTALGIYTSTNAGVTWTFTSKGIEALDVSDIIQTTDAIYAGTSGGLMTSIDNGTHWTNLTPGIAATCLKLIGDTIFCGSSYQPGIMFSNDKGITWKYSKAFNQRVNDIIRIGKTIFTATNNGVYSSADGIDWVRLADKLPNFPDMEIVTSLASDGDYFFASSFTKGLFLSTDQGLSWNPFNASPFDNVIGYSVKGEGNNILVKSFDAMHLSADKGQSWKNINPVNSTLVTATFVNNNIIGQVDTAKLLLSNDLGKNWTDISEGLPPYYDFKNSIRRNDLLFIATNKGVYSRPVSEIPIGIKKEINKKTTFMIYPNPSNGIFTIDRLETNSIVEMIDITGRVIYKVKHGNDKKQIDLSEQPKGIYFLKITNLTGESSCSKIVIR